MNSSRRRFLKQLWVLTGGLAYGFTAEPCPQVTGKTIRFIVPYSPGGGYDVYARLIEQFFEAKTGAQVVVENIPGGGGAVGAGALKASRADGRTLGILNAPGLLTAAISGEDAVPHPGKDFTVLGRVARSRIVWTTGRTSPFRTIQDVIEASSRRPILVGATEVGSTNFMSTTIITDMLAIDMAYISGFPGSRERSLSAVRGEVDIVASTFESDRDWIEAGDLRPLMQISNEPFGSHPSLDGVPCLGGTDGVAAPRVAALGRDVAQAQADINGILALINIGRIIAAPAGLDRTLARCLEQALYEALTDPAFVEKAEIALRSLDVARPEEVLIDLQTAETYARRFMPIMQEAIRKLRK